MKAGDHVVYILDGRKGIADEFLRNYVAVSLGLNRGHTFLNRNLFLT